LKGWGSALVHVCVCVVLTYVPPHPLGEGKENTEGKEVEQGGREGGE